MFLDSGLPARKAKIPVHHPTTGEMEAGASGAEARHKHSAERVNYVGGRARQARRAGAR